MAPGRLYLLGPGTTVAHVSAALGLPAGLFGVDAVLDGRLIARASALTSIDKLRDRLGWSSRLLEALSVRSIASAALWASGWTVWAARCSTSTKQRSSRTCSSSSAPAASTSSCSAWSMRIRRTSGRRSSAATRPRSWAAGSGCATRTWRASTAPPSEARPSRILIEAGVCKKVDLLKSGCVSVIGEFTAEKAADFCRKNKTETALSVGGALTATDAASITSVADMLRAVARGARRRAGPDWSVDGGPGLAAVRGRPLCHVWGVSGRRVLRRGAVWVG